MGFVYLLFGFCAWYGHLFWWTMGEPYNWIGLSLSGLTFDRGQKTRKHGLLCFGSFLLCWKHGVSWLVCSGLLVGLIWFVVYQVSLVLALPYLWLTGWLLGWDSILIGFGWFGVRLHVVLVSQGEVTLCRLAFGWNKTSARRPRETNNNLYNNHNNGSDHVVQILTILIYMISVF